MEQVGKFKVYSMGEVLSVLQTVANTKDVLQKLSMLSKSVKQSKRQGLSRTSHKRNWESASE